MAKDQDQHDEPTPVVIVGMACRFPGDASSPEALWTALSAGESAWSEFPQDRLNINGFYHPSPERSDSFNFKGAHFINQDIAAFDAKFFGVAQTEADAIDPQQRLLLEVAYEAVENAGFPLSTFTGTLTSVFIGSFVKDYEQVSMRDSQTTAPDCATGNGIAIMANRISYFFDLQGTSQTIDTGCSASLVCLHQAVADLRAGRANTAIAGGAGLILTPSTIMPMTSLGFLSEDGKCFTFDSRANGYGRGEGVGIVVLKRLDDAIRDNDTIRAVIRGTASNQDGHTPGITVPNPEAQVRCIDAAYGDAKLAKGETSYVECHGTGTKVGDWRELRAISSALCAERAGQRPMYVGSVKPNIGHLEGSAGVAGVIKAVLIAEKGQIPPHINFREWNPDIKHEEWKVDIARTLMNFPAEGGLRRISVNCFGFGGTNAHGILDDARTFLQQRGLSAHHNTIDPPPDHPSDDGPRVKSESTAGSTSPDAASMNSSWDDLASQSSTSTIDSFPGPYLFPFSAQHRDGIAQLTSAHISHLNRHASSNPDLLREYSYTLTTRRSALDYKGFVIAKSIPELTQKMAKLTQNKSNMARSGLAKPFRPAFIFCGQGAQWPRMAAELMGVEVFAEGIRAAGRYLQGLDKGFDLEGGLFSVGQGEGGGGLQNMNIHHPSLAQPATTAIQMALVDLLRTCGISPVGVAGHSSGEIAAAYAAGILSREAAWEVAFWRGKFAAEVKTPGKMLAVGLSRVAAQDIVDSIPGPAGGTGGGVVVVVACVNSPEMVTLSGDGDAILAIKQNLDNKGVFTALVAVETAYHSHHMQAVAREYGEAIRGIRPREANRGVAMFSSVRGSSSSNSSSSRVAGPELDAGYWVENMVSTVEFEKAVTSLMEEAAPNVLIEVSPHRVWAKALKQILDAAGYKNAPVPYFPMLERGRDAVETVLQLVGDLFLRGYKVEMDWFFRSKQAGRLPKCLADLPPYPWDHSKTYWHESHLSRAHRFRQFGRRDYIGAPTPDGVMPHEPRWRGFFRVAENPWLLDHKVQNEILYPAAGMVVMAVEAASQVVYDVTDSPSDILDFEVSRFEIRAPMVVPANESGLEHCINARRVGDSFCKGVTTWTYDFAIYSKMFEDAPFQENATGRFSVRFYRRGAEWRSQPATLLTKTLDPEWLHKKRGQTPFEFYEGLEVVGMSYGPLFRNIVQLGQAVDKGMQKECWASIAIPNTKAKMPKQFEFDHVIHPATLDAIFQTFFTLGSDPMVPFSIKSVRIANTMPRGAGSRLFGVAAGATVGLREASANIDVWSAATAAADGDDGSHVVQITGLRAMSIASTPAGGVGFLPHHKSLSSTVIWKEDLRYAGFAVADLKEWLDIFGHKNPGRRVLHLGVRTDMVVAVFEALTRDGRGVPCVTPRLVRYTMGWDGVGQYRAGFQEAVKAIVDRNRALLASEKLEDLLSEEDEASRQFDLAIVEDAQLLGRVETLVEPSGYVLLVASGETGVEGEEGAKRLRLHDFDPVGSIHDPELGQLRLFRKKIEARSVASRSRQSAGVVIITPDATSTPEEHLVATLLRERLSSQFGVSASIEPLSYFAPENLDRKGANNTLVISLVELCHNDGFIFHMGPAQYEQVKALLQTSKGLFWVTRGGQMAGSCPWNATFLGWARTVRSEDPSRQIVCLDLEARERQPKEEAAELIQGVFWDAFFGEGGEYANGTVAPDREFAEVGGKIYIPRLAPLEELNMVLEQGPAKWSRSTCKPTRESMKLEIAKPGDLDSFYIGPDGDEASRPLGLDEIRVSVWWTFLFPGDLDTARGKGTRTAFGLDFVGTVTEVGDGVDELHVGQYVVGFAPHGAARGSLVVKEKLVLPIPTQGGGMTEDGTPKPWSLAAVFTAYRAARGVLDVGTPATVLIQRAVDGYGQAAVAVFQHLGAEVIAVVADDTESEALQKMFQIEDDHVLVGGSNLAEAVLQLTGGNGVDLVFDSCSGPENMALSLECANTYGRIFQIVTGSADSDSSYLPARSCELVRFDLHGFLSSGRGMMPLSDDFRALYNAVVTERPPNLLTGGTYTFKEAGGALKNLEKYSFGTPTLLPGKDDNLNETGYNQFHNTALGKVNLDPHGAYIVVGGFGGLGLTMAEWLAEHGARRIVLTSRSGAPNGDALAQKLKELQEASSAQIHTYGLDVCDAAQVRAFSAWLESLGLKVRGVIHAAGVLRDFTYQNMQYPDWALASQVKTIGSWNLHSYLPQTHLDFFLFLSSAAGVIGNRGQSNYAAGNAFQDALAQYRTARGQHTVSLDLGPVIGAGMVDQEMMDLLRSVGYYGIRMHDVLFFVERAISRLPQVPPQIVLGVGSGGLVAQNQPADPFWAETALFAHLNRVDVVADPTGSFSSSTSSSSKQKKDGNLIPRLRMAATIDEAAEILLGPLIAAMVSIIPNLDAADIRPHMTPGECQSDSMRGTNIDNWLKRTTGVSIGQAINGMPLGKICEEVVRRGGFVDVS